MTIYEEFLNAYWLRPETAIWRSIDAELLKKVKFSNPSVDLACGNGLFSFVAHGGKLSNEYDAFGIYVKKGFHKKTDIYNQKWQLSPTIIKKSNHTFDLGVDHKKNLLINAPLLKNYKSTLVHDLGKPFHISRKFKTIFSNSLYWIPEIKSVLSEIRKISEGNVILFCPDKTFRRTPKPYLWWNFIDRGISENVKHCYSFADWKKLFRKCGFNVKTHVNYLSSDFIDFWRQGTRIYSPYMIEALDRKIKKKIIKNMKPFIKSWVSYEKKNFGKDGRFHFFVLE